MEITNQQAWDLYNSLTQLLSPQFILGKRFAYRAALNKAALEPIAKALQRAVDENSVPEIAEFNKVRQQIINKYCVKDKDGVPQTETVQQNGRSFQGYVFDPPELAKVVEQQVRQEFPQIIETLRQHEAEVAKLMQETCEIELKIVTEDDLPDNMPGNCILDLAPMLPTA